MKTIGPRNVWTRSKEGWIAGVCQGLGENFDISPALIRLIWLGSVLFFGVGFLLYFACAFCFPVRGQEYKNDEPFLLGVCQRIADRMELETSLVRVIALFLLLGSFGTVSLVYLIMHFVLPAHKSDAVI